MGQTMKSHSAKKLNNPLRILEKGGAPGATRTPDPQIRRHGFFQAYALGLYGTFFGIAAPITLLTWQSKLLFSIVALKPIGAAFKGEKMPPVDEKTFQKVMRLVHTEPRLLRLGSNIIEKIQQSIIVFEGGELFFHGIEVVPHEKPNAMVAVGW